MACAAACSAPAAARPCCADCTCCTATAAGRAVTGSSPWTSSPWTSATGLRPGQFLGRGSRKLATTARHRGALVAVLSSASSDLAAEAALMAQLSLWPHPHLLPLLHVEFDALSRVQMVVPIARYGSMLDLADELDFDGRALSAAHTALVLLQVAHAVLHLDALGVDHGDVSARNVLVFEYDCDRPVATQVKLGDFGEARAGRAARECIRVLAKELHALAAQ